MQREIENVHLEKLNKELARMSSFASTTSVSLLRYLKFSNGNYYLLSCQKNFCRVKTT